MDLVVTMTFLYNKHIDLNTFDICNKSVFFFYFFFKDIFSDLMSYLTIYDYKIFKLTQREKIPKSRHYSGKYDLKKSCNLRGSPFSILV